MLFAVLGVSFFWLSPVAEATAPSITSLGTVSGSTAGGDSVTITGSNFSNITSVKFGANTASFTVNSTTSITATTPAAGAAGVVDITITNNLSEVGVQYGAFVYTDATHAINKWIGGTTGNLTTWTTGTNWSTGAAPVSTDIIYINGGTYQPVFTMSGPTTFYGLTVGPSTTSTLNVNGGSLTNVLSFSSDTVVGKSGRITQSVGNTTSQVNSLVFSVTGKLTVVSGAQITASALGYSSGNGPGTGTGGGKGCSYAAYGSNGVAPYGNIKQPTDLGSGCNGYAGGGFVKIQTTDLQLDGQINVNGGSYGSAGSIWVDASGTFSGASTGTLNATSSYGSAGRIAVYAGSSTYAGKYYAYASITSGGAGTIYTNIGSQPNGTLTIDNSNYLSTQMTSETSSGAIQYDDFHVNNGGIYEIPAGSSLTLSTLPASSSSTYPGSIVMNGNLTVPNSTTLTNYKLIVGDGTYSDVNPVIGSGATLELRKSDPATPWSIQSLTVNSGGTLTHTANTSTDTYAVNLNASGTVTVNSGGSINVNKKGYSIGNGPGKGTTKIGAGHGGNGIGYNATYGNAYGSVSQPYESGSGGLNNGSGGGRIKIVAQNLVNNGTITSDGSGSGYTGSSGGAGGSTWIDVTGLSGTGSMSSQGGNDYGAGGGRIALYYDTNTMTGAVYAYCGDSGNRGGAGTVYKKVHSHAYGTLSVQAMTGNGRYGDTPILDATSHYESLVVGNAAALIIGSGVNLTTDALLASPSAPYPGYVQLNGTLTVPDGTTLTNYYVYDNGTYSDQNPIIGSGTTFELWNTNPTTSWNVASLTINSGGLLTHPANSTAETYAVNVAATNDITLNAGSNINVQAKGYTCSNGPGTGGPNTAASTYANGGSYGGAGGRPDTSQPTVLYGSATQPNNIGSGGACDSTGANSGSGGGAAILKSSSGNIVVNGTINANGGNGTYTYGAGGSGGSIWLQGNKVTGTGTLSANGGSPYSAAGAAGGGGRIAFTYSNNLQVTSSTPNNGLIAGGNTVTLSGDGFTPTTLINFGANAATNIAYTNVNTLTATVPAAATNGYVDITAKNKYYNGTTAANAGVNSTNYPGTAGSIDPSGTYQVATLTNGYQYGVQAPQISGISPNYGVPAGGNTVTINGQNFMSGVAVSFGGVGATNVTYVSSTQITATVPAHAAGAVDVTVTNTDSGTVTSTNAYTYTDVPTISGITPTSGTTAGGDSVTISGSHFTTGMTVTIGGNAATNVVVVNDTTLTAMTPAGIRGTADVVVANTFTQSATLSGGFHYLSPPPTVSSFTPTNGTMAGGTTVVFTGTNFDSTMKAYFNSTAGTTVGSTATTLTVKTPAGQIGNASVTISGPDTGVLSVGTPFTYVPAAYTFTTFPASLHQTEAGMIRIQAQDQTGQPVLAPQDLVIALASTAGTTQFSLSQNTGWGITSVTIPAGADHADFYVKDTAKGTPTVTATGPDNVTTSSQLTVISRYKFLVTGISDPIDAGTPSSVTVQTTDWLGNPMNDYTGTIHFTSTDSFAQLPGDLAFTADMQGNHTFVNGVSLLTSGEQSVTVTDSTDTDITGSQSNITVQNGYAGPAAKLAMITDPQRVESNKSSTAISVQVQDTNGNPAPVPSAVTIYVTSSSATGSFRADESAAWTAGPTFQVTIPAGATTASFFYKDTTVGDVQLDMRDQASTTDSALTDTTQTISIGAGLPYRLAMSAQDAQLTNKWNPIIITLRDDQDRQLTVGQNPPTAYVTSANSSLQFASDSAGTGATTNYAEQLTTGTNKMVIYVRSATAQQINIHLSDSSPADGNTGLLDDDKLVNFVTQQATHLSLSAASSAAADAATSVTVVALNDNGDVAPVVGDKTVTLSSSGTGMYSLTSSPWNNINSVLMPDGSSSAAIYYRNQTAGTASLQADSALGQATRSMTITPGSYSALAMTGAANVPVDTATQYAVSLRDVFGNQTTSQSDATAYVYTSSPSGAYGASASGPWDATSVSIPAGSSAQTVYYQDSALSRTDTLTASDQSTLDNPDTGIANGTVAISTVGQTVDHLTFISAPASITAGQRSGAITIQAQTAAGQPARVGSDVTLSLASSSSGQPAFYAGAADTTAVTSVTIPAGDSQISFYYSDTKAGTYSLQALTANLSASQSVTVTAGSVNDNGKLIFTTPAQTKESGVASDAVRIATADKFGNESPATADTLVSLGSDCSGVYSLSPTSWNDITDVTIASGSSAAAVYFKSDVSCIMQVSASGFSNAEQAYTIQNGPYRLVVNGPSSLELNQHGTYTITMQDINGNVVASTVDRTIYLNGTGLQPDVPSVVFAIGQTTKTVSATATAVQNATFSVRDEPNIASPDTGLINASADTNVVEGTPTQLGVKTVTPSPSTDNLTHLTVGLLNASGGIVSAPSDTTIALSSSDATGTFRATNSYGSPLITNILLPQGAASVDVYYSQTDAGLATIQAQNASYTSGQLELTTNSGAVASYQLTASADTIERGQTVTYTVSALDKNGNVTVMHYGDSFYIDYADGTINSSNFDSSAHKYTVTSTTSAASFGLTATATGTPTITVSDNYPVATPDVGITDATHALTIVAGSPAKLAFTTPQRSVERGGVTDLINVEIQNAHGAPTTSSGNTTVAMSTTSPTGTFALSTGGPWTDTQFVIPAGISTLSIYYADTSQPSAWQLQAAATGLTPGTQGVSVVGGAPVSLHFVNAPSSLVSYHDSPSFMVELHNQYGYPTNKQNNDSIVLSTDAANGEFADSQHNWQTNVIPWTSSTTVGYSPAMYYRSYTTGVNTITATLPGMTPAEQTIDIIPQVMTHFVVTNVSDPVPVNTPSSVVVIAKDAAGYTVPSYNGTITFSASDPATTVPPPYTFNPPVDKGTHTFVNAVKFASAGEKAVTVVDAVYGVSGTQSAITVIGYLSGSNGKDPSKNTDNASKTPISIISDIPQNDVTVTPDKNTPGSRSQSSNVSTYAPSNEFARTVMSALAPIGTITSQLFDPKNVPYTAPAAVYTVFFGYTLLLAAAGFRDAKSMLILAALLEREKKIAREKNEFMNLLSHHLRTPITIMSGVIDLAMFKRKDPDTAALSQASAQVQRDIERVISTTEQQVGVIDAQSSEPQKPAYRSFRFWLPVLVALIATVVINIAINTNPAYRHRVSTYVVQIIMAIIAVVLLYVIVRNATLRKRERTEVLKELAMRKSLDDAKNDALNQLAHTIDTDVAAFEQAVEGTELANDPKLSAAEEELAAISGTAKLISCTPSVPEHHGTIDIASYLGRYVRRKQASLPRVLTYKSIQPAGLNTVIDEVSLSRVLDTLLDNALKYSPDATPIAFELSETDNHAVITVTNTSAKLSDDIADISHPFMHGEDTLTESVQGVGLSLYADKLVLESFGGTLSVASDSRSVKVTVTLPTV